MKITAILLLIFVGLCLPEEEINHLENIRNAENRRWDKAIDVATQLDLPLENRTSEIAAIWKGVIPPRSCMFAAAFFLKRVDRLESEFIRRYGSSAGPALSEYLKIVRNGDVPGMKNLARVEKELVDNTMKALDEKYGYKSTEKYE